ncbi:MAG: 3-phosphoshikimate 1-carboxyvinyltransferase [Bradymonadia bacterium]
MKLVITPSAALSGSVRVPGDKSVTHRALMLSALCDGVTEITHPGTGEDNLSTLEALKALGVPISFDDAEHFTVTGVGLHGLVAPAKPVDCGNSGTTARLLAGLLAGANVPAILTGDASLQARPMRRIADPLNDLGYSVKTSADGTMPITIEATHVDADAEPTPVRAVLQIASAQVKSCVLLSGLYRGATTEVVEPAVSRDHTERLFRALGVRIGSSGHYANPAGTSEAETLPTTFLTPPSRTLLARGLEIPGDPSSAAFLLAAGMLTGGSVSIEGVMTNPTRAAFLKVWERMGAEVRLRRRATLSSGEPVATITVTGDALLATEIVGAEVPLVIDEIPLLCVVAAASTGTFVVRDAAELRVKESDRIASTVALLRCLGVTVEEEDDGLRFDGLGIAEWGGFTFDAGGDHRLGMAAAVAALCATDVCEVRGSDCIAVSYPGFVEALRSLGCSVEEAV